MVASIRFHFRSNRVGDARHPDGLRARWRRTALVLLILGGGVLAAQQVHVVPRVKPPAKAEPAPPPPDIVTAASGDAAANPDRPIRVNVNLVLVPVSVTDPMDRPVTGLEKQQFRLYEDKKQQQIQSFSNDDAPVSVGIVFDLSGSMKDKIGSSRDALDQFLKTSNPQDQFFLVGFSDQPEIVSGFSSDIDEIENRADLMQPNGRTALLDAIYLALAEMRDARYRRRALLIISDGGDNHSRYTEREIRNVVRESDVQIYSIGIFDPMTERLTPEEQGGPELLADLSQISGGREFTVNDLGELPDIATRIGIALRNQYLLGYAPTDKTRNGKWRKISVKLDPPPGLPPLTVAARSGYYAPRP